MSNLLNPKTKLEQIEGVLDFYWLPVQLKGFRFISNQLNQTALLIFLNEGECISYRAFVIREALIELADKGYIDYTLPIYAISEEI